MKLHVQRAIAREALLFTLILGGAAALGFVPYRLEVAAARYELQRKLLAVGRLEAAGISRWLEARRAEAEGAADGPQIALDVERWLRTGRLEPARRDASAARLERLRSHGGHADVAIATVRGEVLAAALGVATLPPVRADDVRRAVATGAVVFSPLARLGDGDATPALLDAVAPLTAVDVHGSRVVGALVLRIQSRRTLFPLVQAWPTDSASGESLLVERSGGGLRHLSDPRHAAAPPPAPPAADAPGLVATRVAAGARGLVEGLDYRSVPVLAWVEEIEGAPWLLVSKIDRAEVYAPLRDYLGNYLAFLALAAITAGVTTSMRRRGHREASLRREHEATTRHVEALEAARAERERLIASLQKALDEVKTLRGIVPICASCKRIRDDAGYWKQVEAFVSEHTEAQFSHGVCPECARRLYPEAAPTPEPTPPG